MEYNHIIFTRFNVPSPGKEEVIRSDKNWLESRFQLFDKFCFPSVKGQTCADFTWLVFFDEHTPDRYKELISDYQKRLPSFTPVFVSTWNTEVVHSAIRRYLSKDFLLTTRLDNDDAIHKDFVSTLRDQDHEEGVYYNFSDGLTFNKGVAFSHKDLSNAFLSYFEKSDGFQGVWKYAHPDVIQKFQVQQLKLEYAWLQVIHGTNVSNKVRGKMVTPGVWDGYYPAEVSTGLTIPTGFSMVWQNSVMATFREMRDGLIKLLKKFKSFVK